MKELELPSGNFLMFLEIPESESAPEIHEYRIGLEWNTAERVWGSHELMERNGLIEPMNEAMRRWVNRGKRFHTAVEQYWEGTFDYESEWAKSEERAYLDIYVEKFLAKYPEFATPVTVEGLAGSEDYGVATMPDQTHPGFRVMQLKSGHVNAKIHSVQLAIEGFLAFPSALHFERWALYIDPKLYASTDGFKLVQYEDSASVDMVADWFTARKSTVKYQNTRRKPTKAVEKV